MCWMTIRRQRDALANGIIETKESEPYSGGDSWGYAFVEDGEFTIEHGVGEIPDDLDVPVTNNALVHTRFATRGNITETNAHPFEIEKDGETVAVMAHNGTWTSAPRHSLYSDTWFMARAFETFLNEADDFEDALERTADHIGETMVVLHKSGAAYVYSGRYSITRDGPIVQSGRLDEIKSGTIERIDPDGSVEMITKLPEQNFTLYDFAEP